MAFLLRNAATGFRTFVKILGAEHRPNGRALNWLHVPFQKKRRNFRKTREQAQKGKHLLNLYIFVILNLYIFVIKFLVKATSFI